MTSPYANVLGIDFGAKRIGVACIDPLGIGAHPVGMVAVEDGNLAAACRQIGELAAERGATRAVVGLPLNMDDSEGPQAQKARAFGDLLAAETGLAVEYEDERLTSVLAHETVADRTRSIKKRKRAKLKGTIDVIAAQYLLRGWLQRQQALDARRALEEPASDDDAESGSAGPTDAGADPHD